MITQVTSMYFSEKWGENGLESQNVKGNQRYKIILKGT